MSVNFVTADQGNLYTGTGDTTYEKAGVAIGGGIEMSSDINGTPNAGGDESLFINGGVQGPMEDFGTGAGNDQISIASSGYVDSASNPAIFLYGGGHTITNAGSIAASDSTNAIDIDASHGVDTSYDDYITNTGVISGSDSVGQSAIGVIDCAFASGLVLENAGSILGGGGALGLAMNSEGKTSIDNSGLITGGMFLSFGSLSLRNTGRIEGTITTISSEAVLTNRGEIDGDLKFYAFETVRNTGIIDGDVDLDAGANSFDGRGGTVEGRIVGGTGVDTIRLGSDGETVNGAKGHDSIYGGGGADIFVFTSDGSSNWDTIHGFGVGADHIQLAHAEFSMLAKGKTPTFSIGAHASSQTDYLFYDSSTGSVFYDPNGSASGQTVEIANLGAGLKLTAKNFTIA